MGQFTRNLIWKTMASLFKVIPVLEDGRFQPASARTTLFSVVIVYENFEGVIPAKEMAMHSLTQAKPQCEISCRSWQFDFLRSQLSSQQALTAAAQADVVVIAAKAELPTHVKTWLEDWLLQKKNGAADLLVLLDQPPQKDGEACKSLKYLRWIAEARRVDFTCQTTGPQITGHSIYISNQPSGNGAPAYRRWDTNE